MKAMIFAAGVGTRLQPISLHTPKALVSPGNKPMLQLVAEKLIRAGVNRLVINIHHHPELMRNFISRMHYPGVEIIISDETDQLLDTGGGLLKAAHLLMGNEPVILHNVDVLSDVDLKAMMNFHLQHNPLATLAVSERPAQRTFLWESDQLAGWENRATGEKILCTSKPPSQPASLAFSGIHIVQPDIFSLITETGVFSITPVYLRLAGNNKIIPFRHNHELWADIGSAEKLQLAAAMLQNNPEAF